MKRCRYKYKDSCRVFYVFYEPWGEQRKKGGNTGGKSGEGFGEERSGTEGDTTERRRETRDTQGRIEKP